MLPVPDFFDPAQAACWDYRPDPAVLRELAEDWRHAHGLTAAGQDEFRTVLLLVDVQKDFCLEDGSLFVAGRGGHGAIEDCRRTAAFLYRNLEAITEVVCTLDTHLPHQIFFSSFWLDESGRAPHFHREVTAEDVRSGRLRPNPELASWLAAGDGEWLERQVLYYCEELEREGKYTLYLWPPHCLLGSQGHTLVGIVEEARLFHAFSRLAPDHLEGKGSHPLTENYSALSPEVLETFEGEAMTSPNDRLMRQLLAADRLIVAGEAASHCVKSTLEDLLAEIERRDEPELAERIYVLRDCTSAVVVRDAGGEVVADFTPQAEEAFERFARAGMNLVESTAPMAEWPGAGGSG